MFNPPLTAGSQLSDAFSGYDRSARWLYPDDGSSSRHSFPRGRYSYAHSYQWTGCGARGSYAHTYQWDSYAAYAGNTRGLRSSHGHRDRTPGALEPGVFRVGTDGRVKVDYLFDGGAYHGEVAIFSLEGMERLRPGTQAFAREAVARSLSNSALGHVVISDRTEGAKFTGELGERSWNDGPYGGVKTIQMRPGDKVGFMLVPDGTVKSSQYHNYGRNYGRHYGRHYGGSQTPFFSFASGNPGCTAQFTQVVDGVFAWEDLWLLGRSDRDYNDVIFSVDGLVGTGAKFGDVVSRHQDWRDLNLGQEIIKAVLCPEPEPQPEPEPDRTAPVMTASLLRDTAPGGRTNTDRITSLPTIAGSLTDASPIVEFRAGFGSLAESSYVNVLPARQADGSFILDRAQLEQVYGGGLQDGVYTLHLRAKDQFNNAAGVDITFTLDTTTPTPIVDLLPASDSGVSDSDNVTRDNTPTIAGTAEQGATVQLLSNGTVIHQTTSTGTWEFTAPLWADGVYGVRAIATDIAGNESLSSVPLTITIDTALPQLALSTPVDRSPLTVGARLTGQANGTGSAVVAMSYRFDELAEIPVLFDANGAFDQVLNLTGLRPGNHTLMISMTDQAGNVATNSFVVAIASPEPALILREGQSFEVNLDRTLTTLQQLSVLSFTFDAQFDVTDLDSMKDAFEVALVDAAGESLVQRIEVRRDAFFNVTEGLAAALGAGTRLNGQTVSLDLPTLPVGQSAKLIFRLVNNDQDTNTVVTITDLQVQAGGNGVGSVTPLVARTYDTTTPDFAHLMDVSPSLAAKYGRTSLNAATQVLYSSVGIQNQGTYAVRGPLLVVVKNLSDPGVRMVDADGVTPEGLPYYDFTSLLNNQVLDARQESQARNIAFFNPQGIQFTYDLEFLADVNTAPVFTTRPDVEALVGRAYVYDADAVDREQDPLTYRLLVAPEGLAVNATTGVVSWTPTVNDIGTHTVTLQVNDSLGGTALQTYTLTVVDRVPNRPPIFTSTPGVDGKVNVPYTYDADAIDPDSDALVYSLVSGPSAMTIDATTGQIVWTPTASQLGAQMVRLKVEDGKGGAATQEFSVLVQQQPGNHAPVIISSPVTKILPSSTNSSITLDAIIHDFSDRHPNFEDTGPNGLTRGIVQNQLGVDRKPIFNNGYGYITSEQFAQWYNDTNGVNLSTSLPLTLTETAPGSGIYEFSTTNYFPIDGQLFGNEGRPHNYHFTTEINAAFTYRGGEFLNFTGDDDVWVFINNQLVVDLGGLHSPESGTVSVDRLGLTLGQTYSMNIFHAERQTTGSNFRLQTSLGLRSSRSLQEYIYDVSAIDPDQDLLTYSLVTAPEGMRIDPVSGIIRWLPTYSIPLEKIPVSVEVQDGRGGFDIQSYEIGLVDKLPTEIRGTKWNDLNGNGLRETTEPGLAGVSIYLDLNKNGVLDINEPKQITMSDDLSTPNIDETGQYRFTNLLPGNYAVLEVLPEGSIQTYPGTPSNANLLRNGSFEQGSTPNFVSSGFSILSNGSQAIDGWTVIEGVDYKLNIWPASEGVRTIDLDGSPGPGGIKQTFSTIPGHEYLVTFDLAGNFAGGVPIKRMQVNAAGQSAEFSFDSTRSNFSNLGWQPQIWKFTAIDTTTEIQLVSRTQAATFAGWNSFGAVIDNVAVRDLGRSTRVLEGATVTGVDFGNILLNQGPNRSPMLGANRPPALQVGDLLRYPITATDPDNDRLTFDLRLKPEGMTIDATTGMIVWRPQDNQVGPASAVVRVMDGRGGSDWQTVEFQVAPANYQLLFTSALPDNVRLKADRSFQYQARAIDVDGDPITYSLLPGAPSGVTIDASTGLLSWQPTVAQLGTQNLTLKASDGRGGVALQPLTLTVVPATANIAPSIISQPRTITGVAVPSSDQGQNFYLLAYYYQLDVVDPDRDPLSFSLTEAPTGMSLDQQGRLTWAPNLSQIGNHAVTVVVSDGQGGRDTQSFTLEVRNGVGNNAPTIASEPPTLTSVDRLYRYVLSATDPDSDPLIWSLSQAPQGMGIDPQTGVLVWQPTLAQVGTHTISVQVTDRLGAQTTQTFALQVRGTNTPPQINTTPPTQAGINQAYRYQVEATDPEGDSVRFSLASRPDGMTIDPVTGLVQWQPIASQIGNQTVTIQATDAQGAIAQQTYTLVVGATAINQAPNITSQPGLWADPTTGYRYAIAATDPEGDLPTFSLIKGPAGMTVNASTGVVQWTPAIAQVGNQSVSVAAFDSQGLGAVQSYTLTVTPGNAVPVIRSTPTQEIAARSPYRYDVWAVDPDGEPLKFALTQAPDGMTIDAAGRISWLPGVGVVGTYPVTVTVSDSRGAQAIQSFNLAVVPDTQAPKVTLKLGNPQVKVGEVATLLISATDNVGVAGLTLTIDGTPVAVDASGRASLPITRGGNFSAIASAVDAAGNVGSATVPFAATDPRDTAAPFVNFTSLTGGEVIQSRTTVQGTVTDDNLLFYTLSVAPVAGGSFTEIGRGTTTVTNGPLGQFDPSGLLNDSYILRLSATDANGKTSTVDTQVNVAGELKVGNFQLSFNDLSVPVSGLPIQVTRTYDTFNAGTTDDFGYGWRLEFRDTDLRTSLGRDLELEELGVSSKGFKEGTRVYITLPGGKREGFTFKPQVRPISRFLGSSPLYTPAFVADAGNTSTLTVQTTSLIRSETGEFVSPNGGRYNPANAGYGFGGYYELTTKEGIAYRINGMTGDLDTVRDRNGNTLTFTDSSITSSTGQVVTFERDAQNRITAVVDPLGKKVTYQYDALGDLVSVTDRQGNITQFDYNDTRAHYLDKVIDPLGHVGVRSEYDAQGRLIKLLDAAGKPVELIHDPANSVERVKDQLGNTTTYEYDGRGNVVTEVNALGGITRRTYDADNNTLSETDPLGNTTRYTYDSQGNQLTMTDPLGRVTRYTYDTFGNVLTTTDPSGQTTTNRYDARGNLLSISGQANGTMNLVYDAAGNLTRLTDGSGTTAFEYDGRGNVVREVNALGQVKTYTYDGNGNQLTQTQTLTTATGVRSLVTRTEYDAQGRAIRVTDPEGGVTRTVYNQAGQRIQSIDVLGRVTKFVYDDRGQLTETIYPDSTPATDADNPRTRTEYDAAGRTIASLDELGRRTVTEYDALGRQVAVIYPDNTPSDNSDNPRTRTEYDAAGRAIAQIDPRGNRTEYVYNPAGQVVETILPDDTPLNLLDNPRFRSTYDAAGRQMAQTDALGQITTFLYDDLGRPTGQVFTDGTRSVTQYDAAGRVTARIDQAGRATAYDYDALGRLTAVVDALGQRTAYRYNELGNLISQTDANGNATRYDYDGLGRRIATDLPLGQRSTSTYDSVGHLLSTTDFNGQTIAYSYDVRDRLTAKTFPDQTGVQYTYTPTGLPASVTDSRGVTTYSYDAQDRLLQRTDPDGRSISYTYDAAGNRTSVIIPSGNTIYTYDAQNRLKTVLDPDNGRTNYFYDLNGRLVRTELPNGTTETREYDNLNRLTFLENRGPSGVINSFRYTLDATGNRTAVVEHDGRRVEYSYDALYRLTAERIFDPGATAATRVMEYAYDAVGNRLSRSDTGEGTTLYLYDKNDRLLTTTLNGAGTTYAYDNNGNTLSRTGPTGRVAYQWDVENRLVGADTNGDGVIDVRNQYNANGIRVAQVVNGAETRFLIDENQRYAQVLEEYTPGGVIQVSYVYGNDLISQERGVERSFYHSDGLGSIAALTDISGLIIHQYTYDAYGRIINQAGNTENSYLFAGEKRDENLNLDYLRARYLSSEIGQFMSRDLFNGFTTLPFSLKSYQYAKNNPVNYIDPTGYFISLADTASAIGTQAALTNAGLSSLTFGGVKLAAAFVLARALEPAFEARSQALVDIADGDSPEIVFEVYAVSTETIAFGFDLLHRGFNAIDDAKAVGDFVKNLGSLAESYNAISTSARVPSQIRSATNTAAKILYKIVDRPLPVLKSIEVPNLIINETQTVVSGAASFILKLENSLKSTEKLIKVLSNFAKAQEKK